MSMRHWVVSFLGLAFSAGAFAHHGGGGGGSAADGAPVKSAETLARAKFTAAIHWEHTQFENVSSTDLESRTRAIGVEDVGNLPHANTLDRSLLQTIAVEYGVTDHLQLGFSTGTYRGTNLNEGHLHRDGSYGFHDFGDVAGATDSWVNGKFRFLEAGNDQAAVLAGVKFPTGTDDAISREDRSSNTRNTPLDVSHQPGSGAYDFRFGGAWTRRLEVETLDASVLYTHRTEANGFKFGDRIDAGMAFTRRVGDWDGRGLDLVPAFSVSHLRENKVHSATVRNSGGTSVFASLGVRLGLSEAVRLTVTPQVPVLQDLKKGQQEVAFRVQTGLEVSF